LHVPVFPIAEKVCGREGENGRYREREKMVGIERERTHMVGIERERIRELQ